MGEVPNAVGSAVLRTEEGHCGAKFLSGEFATAPWQGALGWIRSPRDQRGEVRRPQVSCPPTPREQPGHRRRPLRHGPSGERAGAPLRKDMPPPATPRSMPPSGPRARLPVRRPSPRRQPAGGTRSPAGRCRFPRLAGPFRIIRSRLPSGTDDACRSPAGRGPLPASPPPEGHAMTSPPDTAN